MGNPPRPEGLLRIGRDVELGGGMRMFVWPVKFKRSVGESLKVLLRLGVASSSSFDDVLRLDMESSRRGR